MGVRHASLLIGVGVLIAAVVTAVPALASSDPSAGSPSKPVNQGGWAPGSEQYSGLTPSQTAQIQQKVLFAQGLRTAGSRPNQPMCPTTPVSAGLCTPPPAKSITIGLQPQPNSCWCGPESTHNLLMHWGIDIAVSTLASPAIENSICDGSTGTDRAHVAYGSNHYQSYNPYVWLVLGNPGGANNGLGDLWNNTVTDIYYNFPEIANVRTYGYDPIQARYRYPLSPYSGYDIRHYFPQNSYNTSGMVIGGYDQNNAYNNGNGFVYNYYYEDLWAAIHNHPLVDQIMW